MLWKAILLTVFLCAGAQMGMAVKMFHWKDSAGRTHFTDDQSKVPQKYLKNSEREMKQSVMTNKEKSLNGQALYESMCAKCHVVGFKDQGRREGLSWAIMNKVTAYPHTEDVLFRKLRHVVDGNIDMPTVEISDEELMEITRYLIKVSMPIH